MRAAVSLFQKKTWSEEEQKVVKVEPIAHKIFGKKFVFDLYENMINPMIRFIHYRNVKPVGWIRVKHYRAMRATKESQCDFDLECSWKHVKYYDSEETVKMKIMAYDIECDSSHGDFPLAIKDYLKLAREIVLEFEKVQKTMYWGKNRLPSSQRTQYQEWIEKPVQFVSLCLHSAFKDGASHPAISRVFTIGRRQPSESQIETTAAQIATELYTYSEAHKATERNRKVQESIDAINEKMRSFQKLKETKSYKSDAVF